MQTNDADGIQPGWKAYARDGTEAGTVREVSSDELVVRAEGDASEPVRVPMALVVEAHAGRVELDLAIEDFGGSTEHEASAPGRDPGKPPDVITDEQIRRFTGG
jgi:hypothetical protein